MKTSDRYLMHTIDATTLSGSKAKGPGAFATMAFLAFVGVLIWAALWADRHFV